MGQDRFMNDFTPVTDGTYIYAEAADGSQVKIRKSDLLTALLTLDKIVVESDFDNYRAIGIYRISGGTIKNSPPNISYGLLVVLSAPPYYLQLAYEVRANLVASAIRTSPSWGSGWSDWKSITLTS